MDLKKQLHEKLNRDRKVIMEEMQVTFTHGTEGGPTMVGGDTGENGTFSPEQKADRGAVEVLQKNLHDFFIKLQVVKSNLQDFMPILDWMRANPAAAPAAQTVRELLTLIQGFEGDCDPATLHVQLNNVMKALGGAGVPYMR